ncbi:Ribosomal RNA small subunit methyltransferase E [Corynebacterium occultum]|uniref:Ribosomal RNA small subunit methyltransferase E n=1 Tax=Corynebacterium occultum TaxID=2675219 RepID=A0A6B8W7M8_9CORY|nr:16S rRNA (uracil(1498)-N(3))-methyltransferase [Corynebacterium occultum]QGU07927.1 Ribosomal RNA small subunit methyltransferase E [Corynebacterium occultum]
MSLPVFHFAAELPGIGDQVTLDGPEGRHAATVKRLGPGELLKLIDGHGGWAEAEVLNATKSALGLKVLAVGQEEAPTPQVTIVQAIPKSERSELAVDLATQGGADEIIAWQAQRCVARWTGPKAAKGVAKWEAAALAAAKQSRRSRVPQIHPEPLGTPELVQLLKATPDALVLVLHEEAATPLKELELEGVAKIYLIVGPEGGIGDEELAKLREAGARAVKLGPAVLRTASAAMVALSALGALTPRW